MSMIERVARALAAQHYCDRYKKPVDDAHVQINVDANWPDYVSTARAAIEAMMTPTEKMIEASWVCTKTRTREQYMAVALATPQQAHHYKAKQRYQAMITAALEE